ncbi:SHOCT domain-containing protein [Glaciecola sp. 2405UD65-10]|uniref:SHOCT domain-containing protein n=1 Tax=Glaciecola sp. 2405UD65-10 TaxID=3397244 RepID=UPI003B5A6F23
MAISIWQVAIFLVVLLPLFFLPTFIALKKNHPYKIPIILVNIFGAALWGLGWIVALVWCFIMPIKSSKNSSSSADEIRKLYELKENGIITEEEFETKKTDLL